MAVFLFKFYFCQQFSIFLDINSLLVKKIKNVDKYLSGKLINFK